MNAMNTKARRSLLMSLFMAAASLFVSPWAVQAKEAKADPSEGQNLVVHVTDIQGMANIDAEWVREDLLRSAFHEAARKYEWLGDYEFKYNAGTPKNARLRLEFTVIDWERTVSNFFEFMISARYFDGDGNIVDLGTFHGIQSGISITSSYDVGDHYLDVAEDAFSQALRKLKEKADASS